MVGLHVEGPEIQGGNRPRNPTCLGDLGREMAGRADQSLADLDITVVTAVPRSASQVASPTVAASCLANSADANLIEADNAFEDNLLVGVCDTTPATHLAARASKFEGA